MTTLTLSPASYATTLPNEVVALDLAIGEVGYTTWQQSLNMNINGTNYYAGRYTNLAGADPWHLPFTFPNVGWGGIPPKPPESFPKGVYTIFFQTCDQNGVNDGIATSNTATITLADDYVGDNGWWWWLLLALLGIGGGYYAYKKLS